MKDNHGREIIMEEYHEKKPFPFGSQGTKIYRVSELKKLLVADLERTYPFELDGLRWDTLKHLIGTEHRSYRVGFDPWAGNGDLPW